MKYAGFPPIPLRETNIAATQIDVAREKAAVLEQLSGKGSGDTVTVPSEVGA